MAVPQSFPAKIYQILENESPDIIQWNNGGLSFRIVDHGRFEREIVPKYFRHNQISSVQRQLNLYGFKCISRGEFKRSFFHPKFRQGDYDTVRKLTRYIPPKQNPEEEKTSKSAPSSEQPKKQPRPAHTSQRSNLESNGASAQFFYNSPSTDGMNRPSAQLHQNQSYMEDMALWPEVWDSMNNTHNNGYAYNSQQGPQETMILQTSMYHQPYHHHQHPVYSHSQQQQPSQHFYHPQQWTHAPTTFNINSVGNYPPQQQMVYQEQPTSNTVAGRDVINSDTSVSSLMTSVSAEDSSAPTTVAVKVEKEDAPVAAVTSKLTSAPSTSTSDGVAVSVNARNTVTVNPDFDLFDDFDLLDDVKKETVVGAAVAAEQQGVRKPAPAAVMCDASCNTILTYSKSHDSLVYMMG
mmetsp:Transcript_17890/g.30025  ORF Transcript_17890/g.30025 Transcript_17890/m.30025 type:complete len:407 (-) Transcript_17890:416-1636(-)